MALRRILVANRGEIAVRVLDAAAGLGLETVAMFSEDDARSLHVVRADRAIGLKGAGARPYLDIEGVVAAAVEAGCDAIHPGYGFLSENAAFARRCAEARITFVGPGAAVLDAFGDKARARALASAAGVPVLRGSDGVASVDDARALLASLGEAGSIVLKAVAGGGGRGMRIVTDASQLGDAYARCQSEATAAFGNGDLYAEQFLPRARHIEVQAAGDANGSIAHAWERDCSVQRRNQKIIEMAPAPGLDASTREQIIDAALRLAREVRLDNLATFEFLLDTSRDDGGFYFIEANPRLQVEHTVTEEVTGIDLVRAQIELAAGRSLADVGLADAPRVRGSAIELRINAETMSADGAVHPAAGTVTVFEPPHGAGVRVDTHVYAGYAQGTAFDPLLAKLIVRSPSGDAGDLTSRALRALAQFRIEGIETNIPFLRALLRDGAVATPAMHVRYIGEHLPRLLEAAGGERAGSAALAADREAKPGLAGARIDTTDPLAVLHHGKTGAAAPPGAKDDDADDGSLPAGTVSIRAPMQGTIISIDVRQGDLVRAGQQLFVMEAMKMEHVVEAPESGMVLDITVAVGDALFKGHRLALLELAEVESEEEQRAERADPDAIRPDLAEVQERHAAGLDAARPDAVARRRKTGQRTARENVEQLCDPGSFIEYGPLVIAAQRRRRTVEDLVANTPADGLIAGIGTVNADRFGPSQSRCIAMSYDYTVLAGTQGQQNHRKKDRMFEIAERWRLPIVFFAEGGGGRPGDTDGIGVAGLDCMAFHFFGRLSGLVPLVGITSGRCFAGNAAILGCCDVVIATKGSNIGMGGPAMIEGGGLGVFRPEEVGPLDVQSRNGVVDIAVEDEEEAVEVAKRYLSYFQGPVERWECADQRALRSAIPENRRRIYDVRSVIETMADAGSVLELRRGFGLGMVTALVRIEGRPLGLIANNPTHLAGAIDADAADKAARFMQLCDAFELPMLFLCDTPGIMVGPEAEKTALVRHASRMFVTGASVTVPCFTIVLRKAYGLGAQAMAAGSFKATAFTIAWPTGEFGGMGLEGAVKLGYRNELAAIEDPAERSATFEEMVERMYRHGKAVNTASHFEIDDVIDPADSRRWVATAVRAMPPAVPRAGKKRSSIDTW